MIKNPSFAVSRRALLRTGAGLVLSSSAIPWSAQANPNPEYRITPKAGRTSLVGEGHPDTSVWAYDGKVPGPILRARQGEPLRIVVDNRLSEATTVHWHGVRLPIAMDGVPGLSQPPIKPGESFTYEFTPPDAGTFWYHPHADSLQQLGRGLAGALIVDEREPIPVDRDILWVLQDWRLTPEGEIASGFGNGMEAAMSGRLGNTATVNGKLSRSEPVRSGERVRLRLVNGALARMMALHFEGHRPVIVAIDGQPCEPHEPDQGRILLGPAMRTEVVIDMLGEPGKRYRVRDDFYEDLAYPLTDLAYDEASPAPAQPPRPMLTLRRNPVPEPDLATAERHELRLQGGMMGGGMMRGMGGMNGMATPGMDGGAAWAINGMSMTGDGHAGMAPLVTLRRGRSYVLSIRNDTAWWHPMHLHGHSFRVLSRNGAPVPHNQWADTVLVQPRETVDIAFVADNPGDWMLHCHVADHQMAGLMTILRIA